MADKINFYTGTKAEFDQTIKSSNGVYFVSDTKEIYKGDVQYGGTHVEPATPNEAGIVKPVTEDFDIDEEGTLSLHDPIGIISFENDKDVNEIGSTIKQLALTWELTIDPAEVLIIRSDSVTVPEVTVDQRSLQLSDLSITSDTDFTLTVKDDKGYEAKATTKILFLNGIYYGVNVYKEEDEIDSDFIEQLTEVLTDEKDCTFTVNPVVDQYIYFALPSRFGEPRFFVGGIEGGFEYIKTLDFENSAGGQEQYIVYKSVNPNLGSTTVEVK